MSDNGSTTASSEGDPQLVFSEPALMSSDDYKMADFVLKAAATPVIVVGIVTNLVAIAVFVRMPSSVTSTFFCLASVLDTGYLIISLPTTVTVLFLSQDRLMQNVYYVSYLLYVSSYVSSALRKVIVCVTMLLSLDRYLMVAFPLRMKRFHHYRRPKLYTAVCALGAFLLDVNVTFRVKITEVFQPAAHNQTMPAAPVIMIQKTKMYSEQPSLFNDFSMASSVLFRYVPLSVLFVCNLLLVVSLVRHSRKIKSKFDGVSDIDVKHSVENGDSSMPVVSKETCSTHNDGTSPSSDGIGQGEGLDPVKNEGHVQGQRKGQSQGQGTAAPTSLKNSGSSRVSSVQRSERQNSSVTVLVYSFLFTLLALPGTIHPLLRIVIPGFAPYDRQHYLALTMSLVYFLLDTVSSAVNFFVYFSTGTAFRAAVRGLMPRGCR